MTSSSRTAALRWAAVALATAAAVFALAFVAGEAARARAMDEVRRQGRAAAELHAAVLRSELEKHRATPFVLAEDPDVAAAVRDPAPERVRALNEKLERLSVRTRAAVIYLLDGRGAALAASNWRLPSSFVGSNYAFRPYFREALANGSAELFALGTVSNRPGLFLSRRVEGPPGAVVVKVEFDALERAWRSAGSPAFVIDQDGVALITSEPSWRFRTLQPSGAARPDGRLRFGAERLSPLPFRRVEGDLVRVAGGRSYVRSSAPAAAPGWTVHVLTPVEPEAAAVWPARLAAGLAGTLLAAGGAWLWRRRTRARRRDAEREAARLELERRVEARTRDLRDANARVLAEMEERRRSEAAAQTLQEELIQANKLATLGQIAAGVAHEINQPVAAIRAYADNAATFLDRGRAQPAQGNLRQIAELTGRIGVITDELRAFARKTRSGPEPTSLAEAVDGALLLLGPRLRQAEVEVRRQGGSDAAVLAGRIRLEQVLLNLLQNAADALDDRPPPRRITLSVRRHGECVRLSVADNGPGLPEAAAAGLFTPFTTTKPDGLGLGLVISRDILADYGGELSHEAGADGGAVFHLDLRPAP